MKKILDFVERNFGYIMLVLAALGILTFCVSCSSDDNPIEDEPDISYLVGTEWEYAFEDNMWMIDKMVLSFVDEKTVEGWYEGRKGMREDFVKYDVVSCEYSYDPMKSHHTLVGGIKFDQFDIDETTLDYFIVTESGLLVSRTVSHSYGLNKDSEPILFKRRK